MKIKQIPVNQIKADKNQPRQIMNEQELNELAVSIKDQGVINPIEIDEENVIVTGERRWRAAKIAGLETIPCVINPVHGKERFLRQIQENIHHNTMNDLDLAKALQKILKDSKVTQAARVGATGASWLSKKFGKSETFFYEKLNLLSEPEKVKQALKEGKTTTSILMALKALKNEYHRNKMRDKILNGEFTNRNIVRAIAQTIKQHPERAELLLAKDWTAIPTNEALKILDKDIEEANEAIREEFEAGEEITALANKLLNAMKERPLEKVSRTNKNFVLLSLSRLRKRIDNYLMHEKISGVIIEN